MPMVLMMKMERMEGRLKKVEILGEVYDCNSVAHHAVRSDPMIDSNGSYHICKPTYCAYRSKNMTGPKKCPLSKTRIKCLQCNIPLCFPIQSNDNINRGTYCFYTHIHSVPLNTRYSLKSGRYVLPTASAHKKSLKRS